MKKVVASDSIAIEMVKQYLGELWKRYKCNSDVFLEVGIRTKDLQSGEKQVRLSIRTIKGQKFEVTVTLDNKQGGIWRAGKLHFTRQHWLPNVAINDARSWIVQSADNTIVFFCSEEKRLQ